MATTRTQLKQWFSRGKKPTAAQFAAAFDSFLHKTEDSIDATDIAGLLQRLELKADNDHNHDGTYAPLEHSHDNYLTEHQDISGKADKVANAISGHFAGLNEAGNLYDSGIGPDDLNHHTVTERIDFFNGSSLFNPSSSGDEDAQNRAYLYKVRCDLAGRDLIVAKSEHFGATDDNYRALSWTVPSGRNSAVYINFFNSYHFWGKCMLKVELISGGTTEVHYLGAWFNPGSLYDPMGFVFASDFSWNIIVKAVNINDDYMQCAFLEVPAAFAGQVRITTIRMKTNWSNNSTTYYATSADVANPDWRGQKYIIAEGARTANPPQYMSGDATGLVPYSSLTYEENGVTNGLKWRDRNSEEDYELLDVPDNHATPVGRYAVDLFYDGQVSVGGRMPDSVINDYYLHFQQKRIDELESSASALQNALGTMASAQQPRLAVHLVRDANNQNQGQIVSDNNVNLNTLVSAGTYTGTCQWDNGMTFGVTMYVHTLQNGNETMVYQVITVTGCGINNYAERYALGGLFWSDWYLIENVTVYTSLIGQCLALYIADANATQQQLQTVYQQGYNAYGLGQTSDQNPYDLDMQHNQNTAWNNGWNDAEGEDSGDPSDPDDPDDPSDPGEENSTEYDEGYEAGSTDEYEGETPNPYNQGNEYYNEWDRGYNDGWLNNPNYESEEPNANEPEEPSQQLTPYQQGYNLGYSGDSYDDSVCPYYDNENQTITDQEAYSQWWEGASNGSNAKMEEELQAQQAQEQAYQEGYMSGTNDESEGDTSNPYSQQNEPDLYSQWRDGYSSGWQQHQDNISMELMAAHDSGREAGETDGTYKATLNPYSQNEPYNLYDYWEDGYAEGWLSNPNNPGPGE